MLFVDHELQKQGLSYTNYSGQLFPIASSFQGLYAYATPFKQLCNDTSISGANVISGVYLNNIFVTIGQSGLYAINHKNGAAYFTSPLPASVKVSGRYAFKDFNIEMTDQPEYKVLFETKYVSNNVYNQTLSGLPLDTKISPVIFLKFADTENKPWGFQRIDNNTTIVRALVIADNEFQRIGAVNILKNLNMRRLPVYKNTPFDANGNYTGIPYNYDNLTLDTTYEPWILSSRAIRVPNTEESLNPNKNFSMVDLEISTIMTHP